MRADELNIGDKVHAHNIENPGAVVVMTITEIKVSALSEDAFLVVEHDDGSIHRPRATNVIPREGSPVTGVDLVYPDGLTRLRIMGLRRA